MNFWFIIFCIYTLHSTNNKSITSIAVITAGKNDLLLNLPHWMYIEATSKWSQTAVQVWFDQFVLLIYWSSPWTLRAWHCIGRSQELPKSIETSCTLNNTTNLRNSQLTNSLCNFSNYKMENNNNNSHTSMFAKWLIVCNYHNYNILTFSGFNKTTV